MRLHQIDLFRSRSAIFDQWLIKQGVKFQGGPSEKVKSSQFIEDAINEQDEEVLMKNENLEEAGKEE